jgi:hypothetical protein
VAGRDRALLLVVLAFALAEQLLFGTTADSAYTTFRYADNIAAGHGAVFNLGERVEGPANFVWLVLLTVPRVLFSIDVAKTATAFSILCVLCCVVLAHRLGGRFGLLAAVLTAVAAGLAANGLQGSETPLFVLLVLAMVNALRTGHAVVSGVLGALSVMTRPEGLVVATAAVLWLIPGAIRGRRSWWSPLAFLLGGWVLVVPWLVWRATYYQQPLMTPPSAMSTPSSYVFPLATAAAIGVALVLHHRLPPSPVPRRRPFVAATVTLAVCALGLPISAASAPEVAQRRAQLAEVMDVGSWLAGALPIGSVISTGGSGALAYAVGIRILVADDNLLARPPILIGYRPAHDCDALPGAYDAAPFRWAGTGAWVTVYPREDQFAKLVGRLATDPRLSYAPCPPA